MICAYCKEPIEPTERATMIWTSETSPGEGKPSLENVAVAAVAHPYCWEREGPDCWEPEAPDTSEA